MTFLQAAILGFVQGITEFLPISSSGHLVVLPEIFGWEVQSLAFDTVLHLGTAVALVAYFFDDMKKTKLWPYIVVGSIPAAVLGFFLDGHIEQTFRGVGWVVVFLILGSALIFFAETLSVFVLIYKVFPSLGRVWSFIFKGGEKTLDGVKSVAIGFFQALSLLPGISRSGATISAGMFLGFDRKFAARFSFLLSIPIVIGAALYKIVFSFDELFLDVSPFVLVAGFLTSFVTGYLTIKFFLRFLKSHSLYVFVIYRMLLAFFLLIFVF